MNTNVADRIWVRRGLQLRQIDSALLCPEGAYVYLNCTIGHRVIFWYNIICLNADLSGRAVSKAWVYGRSPAGIAGSNHPRGMDVFLVVCCQVEVCATG